MLSYNKSYELIEMFYDDCVAFWENARNAKDTPAAHKQAKKDVERITTNPFDPAGEKLDPQAKEDFLKSK